MEDKEYRRKEWYLRREDILRLHNYSCSKCTCTRDSGAVLHVHHREYLPGRRPWQYDSHYLEVLCAGCHYLEHFPEGYPKQIKFYDGTLVPSTGWELYHENELDEQTGHCDWCGRNIRFEYFVWHPSGIEACVGVKHCDHLTGLSYAVEQEKLRDQEKERRSYFCKLDNWAFNDGTYTRRYKRKFFISITPQGNGFKVTINKTIGTSEFASPQEAINHLYDLYVQGKLDPY